MSDRRQPSTHRRPRLARLRSERGQVAIEMIGTTGLLLFAALVAWQLALAGWSAVAAANAARTAARAYSRTGDAQSAKADGEDSLRGDGLLTGSSVTVTGGQISLGGKADARADVVVSIPLIVPGLASPITIPASADIPRTG
jgi:hypothetical protein